MHISPLLGLKECLRASRQRQTERSVLCEPGFISAQRMLSLVRSLQLWPLYRFLSVHALHGRARRLMVNIKVCLTLGACRNGQRGHGHRNCGRDKKISRAHHKRAAKPLLVSTLSCWSLKGAAEPCCW